MQDILDGMSDDQLCGALIVAEALGRLNLCRMIESTISRRAVLN